MARTTLDIDDTLLQEAMSLTRARTKTEVVEAGLREIIRRARLNSLRQKLGTFEFGTTPEDFWRMRHDR